MIRWVVLLAGVLGCSAVGIGAYAAHGFEKELSQQGLEQAEIDDKLRQCDTGVRYHMTHVLALLAIGLLGSGMHSKLRLAAVCLFLLGIALFSGGLYSMVFLDRIGHWAIVPSGGLCFMLGWLVIAAAAFKVSEVES